MRQRATLIGGKLRIWSEVGAETEVERRIRWQHRLRHNEQKFLVVAKACGGKA